MVAFMNRVWTVALFVLLGVFGLPGRVLAGDSVTFALFTRGWPPFEMVVNGEPGGAALGIFKVSMPVGVETHVKMIPASRSVLRTPGDTVYARLECREWMADADLYLWSEPLLALRTVLLSRRGKPVEYEDGSSLQGLTVGCIKSYSYPEVEPLFKSGKATRYDVNSDVVLLRMLKAGRVDVALFDQYTARWVIRMSPELDMDDFHFAAKALGIAELRFAFNRHPGWEARLPEVNRRIRENMETGVYDEIMSQY